jgi:hypothetical protein
MGGPQSVLRGSGFPNNDQGFGYLDAMQVRSTLVHDCCEPLMMCND